MNRQIGIFIRESNACNFGIGLFFLFFFFLVFLGPHLTYGSSQARGQTGAAAAGLHHSHSKKGSEIHLRPTPQHTATPDP